MSEIFTPGQNFKPIAKKKRPDTEKQIEKYFQEQVKAHGGLTWKFVSPANRGVCDRIALMPGGKVWFIELKTSKGKLTELQHQFLIKVRKMSGNVRVIRGKAGVDDWLS